jgi:hypothetical protein
MWALLAIPVPGPQLLKPTQPRVLLATASLGCADIDERRGIPVTQLPADYQPQADDLQPIAFPGQDLPKRELEVACG